MRIYNLQLQNPHNINFQWESFLLAIANSQSGAPKIPKYNFQPYLIKQSICVWMIRILLLKLKIGILFCYRKKNGFIIFKC